MKECTWSPKDKDEEGQLIWEGHIKINVPFQDQRLLFLKKLNLKMGADGKMAAASGDPVDVSIIIHKAVKEHVTEVALTHIESGQRFTDLEALGVYEEGSKVIADVGSFLTSGFKLGKK